MQRASLTWVPAPPHPFSARRAYPRGKDVDGGGVVVRQTFPAPPRAARQSQQSNATTSEKRPERRRSLADGRRRRVFVCWPQIRPTPALTNPHPVKLPVYTRPWCPPPGPPPVPFNRPPSRPLFARGGLIWDHGPSGDVLRGSTVSRCGVRFVNDLSLFVVRSCSCEALWTDQRRGAYLCGNSGGNRALLLVEGGW